MIRVALLLCTSLCAQCWVAGEALLWRPTAFAQYYTILGPSPADPNNDGPKGAFVGPTTHYRWGYRIEAGYCCALLRWTSFNTGFNTRVTARPGESIWVIGGNRPNTLDDSFPQGTATNRGSINYDALDAEASWDCWFVGLRYARIEHTSDTAYLDSSGNAQNTATRSSDHQGIGPRLGMALAYPLWCDIAFSFSIAGNLLIGSSKSTYDYAYSSDPNQSTLLRNRSFDLILPGADLRFGFDWRCDVLHVGLGYEIQSYLNAIEFTITQGVAAPPTSVNLPRPFAVDGFTFHLGACF